MRCGCGLCDANKWVGNSGLLIGMVAMLSQTGLVLFAMFVGLSKDQGGNLGRSEDAMAAWSFLIFFVYVSFVGPTLETIVVCALTTRGTCKQAVFAGVAFVFKDSIIDRTSHALK